MKLLEALEVPLGVSVAGGKMSIILDRSTTIPVKKGQTHCVVEEFATWIVFEVFEGFHDKAQKNRKLGELRVCNIPASAATTQEIEVMMEIDTHGVLTVSAEVRSTGQLTMMTISPKRFCAVDGGSQETGNHSKPWKDVYSRLEHPMDEDKVAQTSVSTATDNNRSFDLV